MNYALVIVILATILIIYLVTKYRRENFCDCPGDKKINPGTKNPFIWPYSASARPGTAMYEEIGKLFPPPDGPLTNLSVQDNVKPRGYFSRSLDGYLPINGK